MRATWTRISDRVSGRWRHDVVHALPNDRIISDDSLFNPFREYAAGIATPKK